MAAVAFAVVATITSVVVMRNCVQAMASANGRDLTIDEPALKSVAIATARSASKSRRGRSPLLARRFSNGRWFCGMIDPAEPQ